MVTKNVKGGIRMKNISKTVFATLVTGCLLVFGADAKALVMELRPSSHTVVLGSAAAIDLWVVGSDPTLGIGGYDMTLNFDPSILSFNSVSLSAAFGATLGPFITPLPGAVNIADVSLELPADLLSLQTASDFMLGAFQFDTLSAGTSPLSISGVTLSDAFGNPVTVSTLGTGLITVTTSPVPEPATLLMFTMGALFLAGIGVRKRKNTA